MCDEIESGLGRTDRMFAFEHEGIRPDVVTIGKALSGGFYPVSAVLASRNVLGLFQPAITAAPSVAARLHAPLRALR